MIIGIEGSDLTGKSTLIKELQKELPKSVVIDYPKLPVDIKTSDMVGVILSYTDEVVYHILNKMKDTIFLCDRFILSELIYSKYLGRKPGETIDDIVNKDVYIFILWAENEAIIKRFNKRGDEFFKLKQIININTLFFNFYYKNHTLNLTEKTDLIYKPTNIWLCENSTFSQMKKNKEIILNKIKEIRSKK